MPLPVIYDFAIALDLRAATALLDLMAATALLDLRAATALLDLRAVEKAGLHGLPEVYEVKCCKNYK